MEISSVRWLSELGMEDPTFIQQCEMDSLDDITAKQLAAALGQEFQHTFSSDSYTSYQSLTPKSSTTFSCSSMEAPQTAFERPTKQLKTSSWTSRATKFTSIPDASSPHLLSFGSQNSPRDNQNFYGGIISGPVKANNDTISRTTPNIQSEFVITQGSYMNPSYVSKIGQGSKGASNTSARTSSHTQDHIMAERKRREKLSQRFIALSAIVPGLKKMDKASVLGDAIKYLKQLQERVKTLENQTEKKVVESVVFVKKSQISYDDDTSSSEDNFVERPDEPLPEIEARVSDKDILIKIHCEKQKGIVVKALAEIEQLHLSVVSTSVTPFANSSLDIIVVAQMEDEFCMTLKDLVKKLKVAITKYI